jgi:cytochrome c oxidase subunit 4
MKLHRPPRPLTLSWLALLLLLTATVTLAYQPLGAFHSPVALTIATLKALIVAAIFMELRASRPLVIAVAATGLFWLAILLWLSSNDFTRRSGFPPAAHSEPWPAVDQSR